MSINFSIRQYINPASPAQGTCYEERIIQRYDFQKRGVIEVKLIASRKMCNVLNDPFNFELPSRRLESLSDGDFDKNGDALDDDLQSFKFINLANPQSNLDPDELVLYLLVMIFAMAQFALIIRYFMRLQIYFDRLQKEIAKKKENQH